MNHSSFKHFYEIEIKKYKIYKIISHIELNLILEYLKSQSILFQVSELFYNNKLKEYELIKIDNYRSKFKNNYRYFCRVPSNIKLNLSINSNTLNYKNFLFYSYLNNIKDCCFINKHNNKVLRKSIFNCFCLEDYNICLCDNTIDYNYLLNFCSDIIYDYINSIDLSSYYYSRFLINKNILNYFIINNLIKIDKLLFNNELYVPYNLYSLFYILYSDKYEVISRLSNGKEDSYVFNINNICFSKYNIKINDYYNNILINKNCSLVLFDENNAPIMLE